LWLALGPEVHKIFLEIDQRGPGKNVKVSVSIVNKAGAGGALAADFVANANDGYTLLGVSTSTKTVIPAVDPKAAAKIHPNDKKRIIRALEVRELTGKPISISSALASSRIAQAESGHRTVTRSLFFTLDVSCVCWIFGSCRTASMVKTIRCLTPLLSITVSPRSLAMTADRISHSTIQMECENCTEGFVCNMDKVCVAVSQAHGHRHWLLRRREGLLLWVFLFEFGDNYRRVPQDQPPQPSVFLMAYIFSYKNQP
jgi:hypothetical protein